MKSSAEHLIAIISAIPTAVAVLDMDMKYIGSSYAWNEEFSLKGKEILGKSHYQIFPEIGDEWKAIHRECLKGKSKKNPKDRFVRLDGTVQWLCWEVKPWTDENGNIGGMIMYSEDITDRVASEIEIKRGVDLFNETNGAARIGLWEYNLTTDHLLWSPIVRQIHEVSEEFTPDTTNLKQFFKDNTQKDTFDKLINDAICNGSSFDEDQEILTANGNKRWIRLRGNPQFEDGKCVRISGTIQDIQELKIQSVLLKDSEEKYKSIIENSLNAQFLIQSGGLILEANKAARDMFGYSIEEMHALNREDILDFKDPNIDKYIRIREETGSAKAILTGIRKNGEHFPSEVSSVTFMDSNGILRTSVSMVDITDRKKAEENLQLSEAEFRAAFECSALGMSLMNLTGKFIRVNDSFCKILGYTNRELMALTFKELSHPEDVDKDLKLMKEVLNGSKKSYHLEKRYLHKSGAVIWVHKAGSIVLNSQSKPSHWTVQIQDITEQKIVENTLREERELLRTLIDNIPTSIYIKDLELRKTLVNKAECEFMGVKDQSEILGKNNYELFPEAFARTTTAEDREVLTTGKSIINEEKVLTWSDGSIQHLLTSKMPLYYKETISGLLGITHDISKIKEAEIALFESEQKFRRIFENIQDVFYQTDQAGIVTEISPSIEKHSGYSREEVIGKPVIDFYYNVEDREDLVKTISTQRIVTDFEVRLKTKAGEKRYSSVNAQLIIRNGVIIGTEGSMRDVSERKLNEDSLQRLNNELNLLNDQKNKLLSVIAHDLRNPIAGCVGLLEVVFTDVENTSKEELIGYMEMMQKGALNAHELLEDLLEWARIQFNSVDFIPTVIPDLKNNVGHILNKLMPIAEAKDIQLNQNIEEGLSIMADKHMLASVIRNLVTNAIKFTNKGGRVGISAKKQKNGVIFSVIDNGIGLAEKDIDKLFSDNTNFTSYGTQGEKGTGMGLSLCRNFVEKHGGKIWVESAQNSGSKFYFNIPDQETINQKQNSF